MGDPANNDDRALLIANDDPVSSPVQLDRAHATGVLNDTLAVVLRAKPWQQALTGFGVGWLSGYLFRKVSRTLAVVVGVSFLAVQGAVALGVIKVNWGSLRRVARRNMKQVESKVSQLVSTGVIQDATISDVVLNFCSHHGYLSAGFATGILFGLTGIIL